MKPVRFYHFNAHGKVISVAASSREEAEGKVRRHLTRRAKSHVFSSTTADQTKPHPSADHVLKEDVKDITETTYHNTPENAKKIGWGDDRIRPFLKGDKNSKYVKHDLRKGEFHYTNEPGNLKEDAEELDEVLSLQQRQKRAMSMRRNRPKIDRARKLAQRRMASSDNIKNRAFIRARDLVRQRVAGKQGAQYHELGPSQKMIIDKQVEKKKKLIKKLALRLLPRVKQDEQKRLQSFLKGSSLKNQGAAEGQRVTESINTIFAEKFEASKPFGKNPKANVVDVDDQASKKSAKGKELPGNKSIVMFSKFSDAAQNESAAFKSLVKKSEKHGIDLEVLGEVFDRGYNDWSDDLDVTAEQHAFARVNSFINQGKSYFEEDADLQEISKDAMKSYLTKSKHSSSAAWRDDEGNVVNKPSKDALKTLSKRYKGQNRAEKKLAEDAELQEVSSSRANSPAFRAAQKNAAELSDQRRGKPAPTRNLAKKTADSWKSFSRELEKTHKEAAKHHHGEYLKHRAAYKETSDVYHEMETNHKNFGYTSKDQSHGALEELQATMDHHAEKMTHHYDRASYHNNMLDKPLKLKEEVELDEDTKHPDEDVVSKALKVGLNRATYSSKATGSRHQINFDGKHYRCGMMRGSTLSGLLHTIDGRVNNKPLKEEVELDEVSKATLGSYINKSHAAANATVKRMSKLEKFAKDHKVNVNNTMEGGKSGRRYKDMNREVKNRGTGIERATKKLTKEEAAKLSEARPVGNKEYDKTEKAWNERKKDFEKNFDKDGKPKKLKEASQDEINAYVSKAQETTKRYKDMWVTHSKGSGIVTAHDPNKKNHVIVTATGGKDHTEHSVHIKDLHKWDSKTATHVPVHSKADLKNLLEDLEEGTMQPYVKPHTNEKGEQVGWKSCNKHGKTKYWQMFAKASAHKHAGLELKEELEKVGTYTTNAGSKLTLHRNSADRKHHMLVNEKGQSVKGFYKPTAEVHSDLTGNAHGLKGALHEDCDKNSRLRMKVKTVERDDDDEGENPTNVKSVHSKHQQIIKKIVEQQLDPKKREVGTDDTPGQGKSLKETAFSSDKKPVVVPAHFDDHGNRIPAKTVLRRTRRMIVNPNDNPNDGK